MVKTQVCEQPQYKKHNSSKTSKKKVVHTSTGKEKCPQYVFSSKWHFEETSKTSKDRCWKGQRVKQFAIKVVDLDDVEV